MPHELKFPTQTKALQPQDRVSDVTSLLKRITADDASAPAEPNSPQSTAAASAQLLFKGSKLTARLPGGIHHRLRVHAAMQNKTIEDFVIELLDAQLPRGLGESE